KTIQKIDHDTNSFSYNTAVSQFMICVNELATMRCHKRSILEKLLILLTPYAPHLSEELWQYIGNNESILNAPYPVFDEQYTKESAFNYPIAINGKTRSEIGFSLDAAIPDMEKEVLANEVVQKWLEGKAPKKVIIVKGKMINVVI
ncbi:class I tRNA ligase family protein, partial [Chitinophaga sp.]|uniref:class I tRNA ligase family protein n=1 Tax=Chitinophaga sp. TaxID=1869181 RepID=UPI002F955F5C